jgi:hypothetical protein
MQQRRGGALRAGARLARRRACGFCTAMRE